METTNNQNYDILKTEEFIKIAKELHKDSEGNPLYSYEKTRYISNIEKVIITCKNHGDFLQSPKKHKVLQGCSLCGKIKAANKLKLSTKDFIKKAIESHHDENGQPLFDYDESDYKGNDIPVIIKCKKAGHRFEQTPTNHYRNGCKYCSGCYKRDTEDFIRRSIEIHKDDEGKPLYDYSKVEYITTEDKVEIKCRNGHTFFQTPHHHLNHGCDFCARGVYIQNTEQLIEEARKVHGDKYDYSNSIYTGMNNHIIIKCEEHGEFLQVVLCHITYGRGCIKCAQQKNGILQRKTLEKFIEEANIIHENKFDYSRVHESYEKSDSKINIKCSKCEVNFMMRVKDHLYGQGCPNCKNKTHVVLFDFLRKEHGTETFVSEKKFEGCKNKNYLPFDFYSKEHNLIIELDGRQHFEEVNIFRETLEIRHKIDFKKMYFLQKNNISLIRIYQEDVYENRYDWRNDLINNINIHLENKDIFKICYLSKNNKYEDYKNKYEKYLIEYNEKNIEEIIYIDEEDECEFIED